VALRSMKIVMRTVNNKASSYVSHSFYLMCNIILSLSYTYQYSKNLMEQYT